MEPGRSGIDYQKVVDIEDRGEVFSYKVHLLPPTKAFKMATRLTKMIGEPLAAMVSAPIKKGKGKEADADIGESLPKAVRTLTANLADDETMEMVKQLIGTCTLKGSEINFENHFQGRLGHMLNLVVKVVEVQFSDFFEAITEQAKSLIAKAKKD